MWIELVNNITECFKQDIQITNRTTFNNKNIGKQITHYRIQYKKGQVSSEKYLQLKKLGIDLAKEGSLM